MEPLTVGKEYTRKDIRKIFNIPGEKGGNFDTGYSEYDGRYFIFSTIDSPGRTGHDYANKWIGYELEWYSKNNHSLSSNAVQRLINAGDSRYIFTRKDSASISFIYQGHGTVKELFNQKPAKVIWDFSFDQDLLPEEISLDTSCLSEGAKKRITVNAYERNPVARKKCIDHYGYRCTICEFDFEEVYGSLGKSFIHVHHLIPLKDIGIEYEVDPIQDLRPICPNCHAMLHRMNSALSIETLRELVHKEVRNL